MQKKVLALHDLSGFGRSSLVPIIAAISAAGHQCVPLPTAYFSTHMAIPGWETVDLTGVMPRVIDQYDRLGLRFESVYAGFLGSADQIDCVRDAVLRLKSENGTAFIDPVMGDNGEVYATYTPEMCTRMRELCEIADIITPNTTEAAILLDRAPTSAPQNETEAQEWLHALHSRYGAQVGSAVRFIGVPKTIDNDLCLTDHTPGYGSAAKYIGVVMKEIIRDATVYGTKYVTVVEIMGRNAGWLTAAAALAKSDDCEGVDMICLPEVPFNVEHFIEKVRVMQEKKPSIVIAVSEGVKLEDGRYVCELADDVHAVDAFGHKALTGTARYLANVVARNLDTKTRCIELSTLQRCAGHLTSRTDITEAYQVGGAAVKAAFEGVTGQMVALKRISNSPYQCTTELHPISEVANLEKKVPLSWMNENHTQMTEDFLAYARPLIQAELTPLYIAGLPHHIYMKPQK